MGQVGYLLTCPRMFWAEIWKISEFFYLKIFRFLEVKFSMYLNRCVFVMQRVYFCDFIFAFFEPKNYFLSNYTLLGWFKCSSFVEAEKKKISFSHLVCNMHAYTNIHRHHCLSSCFMQCQSLCVMLLSPRERHHGWRKLAHEVCKFLSKITILSPSS